MTQGTKPNSVKMVCQAYVLRGVNASRTFFLDLLRQFQLLSILRYPVVLPINKFETKMMKSKVFRWIFQPQFEIKFASCHHVNRSNRFFVIKVCLVLSIDVHSTTSCTQQVWNSHASRKVLMVVHLRVHEADVHNYFCISF